MNSNSRIAEPLRILVVDDNEDAADMVRTLLNLEGHEVHVVYGGTDALSEARAFLPDVIVLDLHMDDLDGLDVARVIRTEPSFRSTRLIALTGFCRQEDRQRTREVGFNAHLAKPVSRQELLEAIAGAS